MGEVHRCTRCIMDDSADPYITFDRDGQCNYCTIALQKKDHWYHPNEKGEKKLEELISRIKEESKGKKYDCLMGLSGGLDSSYLAYLGAHKWGLRIAAVHIDDGYDTEISTENIKKLCDKAGIELITIRPNAEQYNALTKAYMKAGVPNLAVPQDNILFAYLYDFARKNKIKYFLSGANYALECILQKGNTWNAYDLKNLRDIQKRFGEKPIDQLKFISMFQKKLDNWLYGLKTVTPLDDIEYNRDKAFQELKDFCDFQYYGRKHLENYLTSFIQLYWLPRKFKVDKRTSHLSSMIVSGQMTRDEALKEYEQPLYEENYMQKVKELLCTNIGISAEELEELTSSLGKQHDAYKISAFYRLKRFVYRIASKVVHIAK